MITEIYYHWYYHWYTDTWSSSLATSFFFVPGLTRPPRDEQHYLVGGWATPSEKYESVGMMTWPQYDGKKCSKPPTSYAYEIIFNGYLPRLAPSAVVRSRPQSSSPGERHSVAGQQLLRAAWLDLSALSSGNPWRLAKRWRDGSQWALVRSVCLNG